jgi:hypothetical protein
MANRIEIKKKTELPRGNFFILDGYHVHVIEGKFHCNGFVFNTYKHLKFAVAYFNKRFKDFN